MSIDACLLSTWIFECQPINNERGIAHRYGAICKVGGLQVIYFKCGFIELAAAIDVQLGKGAGDCSLSGKAPLYIRYQIFEDYLQYIQVCLIKTGQQIEIVFILV